MGLGADRAGGDGGGVVTVDFGFTLLVTVRLVGAAEGVEDASSSVESPSWVFTKSSKGIPGMNRLISSSESRCFQESSS